MQVRPERGELADNDLKQKLAAEHDAPLTQYPDLESGDIGSAGPVTVYSCAKWEGETTDL